MKKQKSNQTIFYPQLNDFCRKYLDSSKAVSAMDRNLFPQRLTDIQKSIFEQFLLFDQVSFGVVGENIPLAVLINFFGRKGFEALLEQRAVGFVLRTQNIVHFADEVNGVNPLGWGTFNEEHYLDPEKSIEAGLKWANPNLGRRERSSLIVKILPTYAVTRDGLAEMSVKAVESAFLSGKLKGLGFDPKVIELTAFPKEKRMLFNKCADEVMSYTLLCEGQMTSFSKFEYFHLFNESARKIADISKTSGGFDKIAKTQDIPDLKMLYEKLESPLKRVPAIRGKRSSIRFREWLASATDNESGRGVTREYTEAIADGRGFFQSNTGKISKSIATTAIAAAVGALLDSQLEGAVIAGSLALSKVLDPLADLGLDLLDTYVLDGLTKGWTPKIFFDDLERLAGDA